jgi:hypothetical protein
MCGADVQAEDEQQGGDDQLPARHAEQGGNKPDPHPEGSAGEGTPHPPRRGAQRQRIARRRLQQQQQPDRRQQQSDDLLEPADRQPRQPPRTHPGRGRGGQCQGQDLWPMGSQRRHGQDEGTRRRRCEEGDKANKQIEPHGGMGGQQEHRHQHRQAKPAPPRPIRPPSSPITAPHRAALTSPSAQAASGVAPRRAARRCRPRRGQGHCGAPHAAAATAPGCRHPDRSHRG